MAKAKSELFKITKVQMESGCTKYSLYKNLGWTNIFLEGSFYHLMSEHDSFPQAMEHMDKLYSTYLNSTHHTKESTVWPGKS